MLLNLRLGKWLSKRSSLRSKVKEILEKDSISKIDNVILSSVVFNNSLIKVTNKNELNELKDKYKSDFEKVTFLCFRKKTLECIIDLIRGTSYE